MCTDPARRRVIIVQGWVRQYRQAFYEQLRERLGALGIDLVLIHGLPAGVHGQRGDTVRLAWAIPVDRRHLRIGRYEISWQPCTDLLRDADLVIVEQASRQLLNYVLLVRQVVGGPLVAFWGHGRNFQAVTPIQRGAEAVKRAVSRQSHWFFAYNDLSAEALDAIGYPPDRVTSVGNSIDVTAMAAARDRVTDEERRSLRRELGLQGPHVGIYCGAMYPEKRLPFLITSAQEIRRRVPDFELVCIGSGVERHVIEEAAAAHSWIHYVGPQFGDDLARHFAIARVLLMPGLVGLAVLDSFVLGVPLVTTADALHSPEISYMVDGLNGVMVPGDGSNGAFAAAVVRILEDEAWHEHLVEGCQATAAAHSIEAMADRFAVGVVAALDAGPRRTGHPSSGDAPRQVRRVWSGWRPSLR